MNYFQDALKILRISPVDSVLNLTSSSLAAAIPHSTVCPATKKKMLYTY